MRNRFTKLIFPLVAALLLAPWPVAYAYSYEGELAGQGLIQVEAAEPSATPSAVAFGRAIGGVTSGDLFYIDATDSATDFTVTLYITNAEELSHCYRYLILEVGVYVESEAGEWVRASGYDSEPAPETFITLRNGYVSFSLYGYARYKITIDGGSFYCLTAAADGGTLSPKFYLTVD